MSHIQTLLETVPPGWFVYAMGEQVKHISRKGDKHDHITWYCEIQHRRGGLMTRATGDTLAWAIANAIKALDLTRAAECFGDDACVG